MNKRYQIYLKQENVSALDKTAEILKTTRSEIIRRMVDEMATSLSSRVKKFQADTKRGLGILDKMVGSLSFSAKPQANAKNLDKIYESR